MVVEVNPEKGLHYFGNHYRPVPLEQTYIGSGSWHQLGVFFAAWLDGRVFYGSIQVSRIRRPSSVSTP